MLCEGEMKTAGFNLEERLMELSCDRCSHSYVIVAGKGTLRKQCRIDMCCMLPRVNIAEVVDDRGTKPFFICQGFAERKDKVGIWM